MGRFSIALFRCEGNYRKTQHISWEKARQIVSGTGLYGGGANDKLIFSNGFYALLLINRGISNCQVKILWLKRYFTLIRL